MILLLQVDQIWLMLCCFFLFFAALHNYVILTANFVLPNPHSFKKNHTAWWLLWPCNYKLQVCTYIKCIAYGVVTLCRSNPILFMVLTFKRISMKLHNIYICTTMYINNHFKYIRTYIDRQTQLIGQDDSFHGSLQWYLSRNKKNSLLTHAPSIYSN